MTTSISTVRLIDIGLMLCWLLLSGCTALVPKRASDFNPEAISTLLFVVDKPKELYGIPLTESGLIKQVDANLADAGYPIAADNPGEASHVLTAVLGPIRLGALPVGFSFKAGNSDPRSLAFQKAEVMSITCSLRAKDRPDLLAELTMDIDGKAIRHATEPAVYEAELIDLLSTEISTVCYNLLNGIELPRQNGNTREQQVSPSWLPEIRIEQQTVPEIRQSDEATDEQHKIQNPSGKRIIIRNNGSPVIFTWGHERK